MLKREAKCIFYNTDSGHYHIKFTHKGKQISIVAKIKTEDGEIRHAQNKNEAKLAINQYIANGGSIDKKILKEKTATLKECIAEYLKYCALQEKKRTDLIEKYCNYFLDFLSEYRYKGNSNNIYVEEITTNDIIQYMVKRKTDKVIHQSNKGPVWRGRYISPSTINRELRSIRGLFTYLARILKILKVNPCLDIEELPETPVNKIPPTLEQEERILELASAEDYQFLVMLILFDTLGSRKSEINNLKWENVHLEGNRLLPYGFIDFINRKNNKNLRLPLSEELQTLLNNLPRLSEYVFTNPKTGTKYNNRYKKLNRILEEVGIKKLGVGYHIFRHNTAATLEREGVEASTIKDILGNTTGVVLSTYLNQGIQRKQEVINLSCERIKKYVKKCEKIKNGQKTDKKQQVGNYLRIVRS